MGSRQILIADPSGGLSKNDIVQMADGKYLVLRIENGYAVCAKIVGA